MIRLLVLLALLISAAAQAAEPASATRSTKAAPKGAAGKEAATPDLGTNIIGSQEAPTVLNVVPWKDNQVKLRKGDPTTFLLNRVLDPLDPEILNREIQYYKLMHEQKAGDDLFLK